MFQDRPIASFFSILLFVLAGVCFSFSVRAAELDGMMEICADKKVCPWFKAKVVPPKGWVEDEAWTKHYKAVFLFRTGERGTDAPVMYVRSHPGDKALGLDAYIKNAQDKWKYVSAGSSIEARADVAVAGHPAFKVFLYKNPAVADQAFELTAFKKDTDPAHENQTYFQQVVLIAPTLDAIEAAQPAFEALLAKL